MNNLKYIYMAHAKPLSEPMLEYCEFEQISWNVNRNSCIFIQENPRENVVCEMAVILSRPQYDICGVPIITDERNATGFDEMSGKFLKIGATQLMNLSILEYELAVFFWNSNLAAWLKLGNKPLQDILCLISLGRSNLLCRE